MSLVSSILSPFPLIDLAFSPPLLVLWLKIYDVFFSQSFVANAFSNAKGSLTSPFLPGVSLWLSTIHSYCILYFMFSILADVSWISHSPPSARSFSVTANHSPNNVVAPPLSPISHHNLWTCICLSYPIVVLCTLSKNLIKLRNIRASIHLRNKLSVNHSLKNVVTAALSSRSAWTFRTCVYQHWACAYFCRNSVSQIYKGLIMCPPLLFHFSGWESQLCEKQK